MITPASNDSPLVFGEFLGHLRRQGFTVGVDNYLRLQELLNKISADCAPSDLKSLLCPIVATNKIQQEQFYRAFDAYFAIFNSADMATRPTGDALPIGATEPKPVAARKWPYVLASVLLMALILAVALVTTRNQGKIESPQPKTPAISNVPVIPLAPREAKPPVNPPLAIETPPQATAEPQKPPPDPNAGRELNFYQRYGTAIRLVLVAAPFVFFLSYEIYRFNRRKLALNTQRGKKPPYAWPMKVERPRLGVYDSEQFHTAARLMRRRQISELHRLDVRATIAATVESRGYPSFRYKPDSKPPEYLVLIDRASFRDHQSQLFSELVKGFEREQVFIVHFFYDGDPRVCHSETGYSTHLSELQNKYAEHRLLIFGDGDKIVDPITGMLENWAAAFLVWKERVVLTPEVPVQWGLRELTLASEFIVLPATLKALLSMVDGFESPVTIHPRIWQQNGLEAPPHELDWSRWVEPLRNYLGEEAFQWLCACAVYPELHWDLTLYLGSLSCMRAGLITEDNLLRLIRLPWFRSGSLSDELRWALVRELDREKEPEIRSAIINLLEKNPPPKGTFAEDAYRLNLAVQRWLYRRNRKRRRELLRILRTLPRSRIVQDHTLLRFLESARHSPLDIILPRRLRKLFYQKGIPAFGLRTSARLILTLVAASAAWLGVTPLVTPQNPPNLLAKNLETNPVPSIAERLAAEELAQAQRAEEERARIQAQIANSMKSLSKARKKGASLPRFSLTPPLLTPPMLMMAPRPEPTLRPPSLVVPETVLVDPRLEPQKIDQPPAKETPQSDSKQGPGDPRPGNPTTTGNIQGRVVDPAGTPLANVRVLAVNESTQDTHGTTTDRDGSFLVMYLPPGLYRITASMSGLAIAEIRAFAVRIAMTNVLNPPIQLGTLESRANAATRDPQAVAYSPEGKFFITISGTIASLWDAATGQVIGRLFGSAGTLRKAAFSPDGRRLATAGDDGAGRIWDIPSGKALLVMNHRVPLINITFSPDGKTITTYGKDGTRVVWDSITGERIEAPKAERKKD